MNVGFAGWLPADHVFPEEGEEFSATLKAVRYPIAGAMVAIPARRFPRPASSATGIDSTITTSCEPNSPVALLVAVG